MNIVVEIAPPLIGAVEGRRRLELGIPPNSDVGDLLDTLLKLYPKLLQHVSSDARKGGSGLNIFWANRPSGQLPMRPRLLEGEKLYLCAPATKRVAEGIV
jgi:hypothetical protein